MKVLWVGRQLDGLQRSLRMVFCQRKQSERRRAVQEMTGK
jgi:hypothetical protein